MVIFSETPRQIVVFLCFIAALSKKNCSIHNLTEYFVRNIHRLVIA